MACVNVALGLGAGVLICAVEVVVIKATNATVQMLNNNFFILNFCLKIFCCIKK